jgi:hypothetical protein
VKVKISDFEEAVGKCIFDKAGHDFHSLGFDFVSFLLLTQQKIAVSLFVFE